MEQKLKILGIDWGKAKIGLAISEGVLAEPLQVVKYSSQEEALEKTSDIIKKEGIEEIVIGISEGESEALAREFGSLLEGKLGIKVNFENETLTTVEAEAQAIEAGVPRERRKKMEDAYSAAIILQSYLDRREGI